jgi:nucleotide-binding universal stress UspA family protein
MSSVGHGRTHRLVLVVGFDGTEAAKRALERAAEMLVDLRGRMEVVYVSHVPEMMGLSGQAMRGLVNEESALVDRIKEVLRGTEVTWSFQLRNGETVRELLSASAEQLESEGPNTRLILVLGGSARKITRYLDSTPVKAIRRDRFEVLVVP